MLTNLWPQAEAIVSNKPAKHLDPPPSPLSFPTTEKPPESHERFGLGINCWIQANISMPSSESMKTEDIL